METTLFDDLVQSLKEAKEIAKGTRAPSRCFTVEQPDVKAIRAKTHLTQDQFADVLRVSVKTLRNWEQQRRHPTGPAVALLKIVDTAPEVALKALHAA